MNGAADLDHRQVMMMVDLLVANPVASTLLHRRRQDGVSLHHLIEKAEECGVTARLFRDEVSASLAEMVASKRGDGCEQVGARIVQEWWMRKTINVEDPVLWWARRMEKIFAKLRAHIDKMEVVPAMGSSAMVDALENRTGEPSPTPICDSEA